jgi:MGT family glycosyltransferase
MKALFVPFAPSLAHVSRCLAVAEAWKRAGHTAIFAVGEERSEMVRGAGFDARSLPEVPGGVFRKDRGWRWLTPSYFDQNIHAEQAIIAGERPDVVVFDFRFTTAVSARLANLPSVSILHGNAIRLIRQPRQTAQLMIGDLRGVHGVASLKMAILQRLFPFFFTAIMRRIAHRFSRRLKAYGMAEVDSIFMLLAGDEILVADIAEFLPPNLPSNHHVVGPLMWAGWAQPAPWLEEGKTQPLIYVTMGSTVEVRATLVTIINGLRDAPYNVIISTGSLTLPPDLQIPSQMRLFSMVPGTTVMRSSRVVIHHGGHETLMQALAEGVPSLMLPMNPDQTLVAQQAQTLGVGRSLGMPGNLPIGSSMLRKLTSMQVRQEVDRLVADQECQMNCAKLKDKIKAGDGASLAAEVLERVVNSRERGNTTS